MEEQIDTLMPEISAPLKIKREYRPVVTEFLEKNQLEYSIADDTNAANVFVYLRNITPEKAFYWGAKLQSYLSIDSNIF